ncbi:hypothetical protein M422DRAFT_43688 [Sphaerobolus stellatus SS14]|nr:hypothetical protein M422DRAFT_43688 [Sphaerobolus stellatus SS14]
MARRTDIEANTAISVVATTSKGSLLIPTHTAALLANPTIAHPVTDVLILEHNLLQPESNARCMAHLDFKPTSFTTVSVASIPNTVLIAAGGSHSELHLSLHSFPAQATGEPSKPIWKHEVRPNSEDIINALVFVPTSVTDDSRGPKAELRLITCVNNRSVNFYDVSIQANIKTAERMRLCGQLATETISDGNF